MKIFIGFGYNENDKWINDLIIPFIEELDCEVVTGEEMQGENLSEGVISRIKESDACIGFLTRRGEANANGIFATHSWVISELTAAVTLNKTIFELREKNIDPQKGMMGDKQRYEFDDKASLMLEIAKFISKERSKLIYKTFILLPKEFSDEIRPNLKYATCKYRFLYKAKFYDPEETRLEKLGQGSFGIIIKKIPSEEAQIEITVEAPGGISWSSEFISVGLLNVNLQKDNYKIAQGYEYRGNDYWDWWIWIESDDDNLDKIDNVIYNLHYTFRQPVRIIKTREDKFKLKTSGWGTFTIYARLNFKDNSVLELEHELELSYPSGEKNVV